MFQTKAQHLSEFTKLFIFSNKKRTFGKPKVQSRA